MIDNFPKRKRSRLPSFNYSAPGGYFITICTHHRQATLSNVGAIHESPVLQLTAYGKIVDEWINRIPSHLNVTVDRYVIMPNHIHMILIINSDLSERAIRESPLQSRSTLSKAVGYVKMNVSKEIHNKFGKTPVWQRGYHDHVIRDQHDYEKITKYISENPLKWQNDCFYTEN